MLSLPETRTFPIGSRCCGGRRGQEKNLVVNGYRSWIFQTLFSPFPKHSKVPVWLSFRDWRTAIEPTSPESDRTARASREPP